MSLPPTSDETVLTILDRVEDLSEDVVDDDDDDDDDVRPLKIDLGSRAGAATVAKRQRAASVILMCFILF
jgi:hypothetical protein